MAQKIKRCENCAYRAKRGKLAITEQKLNNQGKPYITVNERVYKCSHHRKDVKLTDYCDTWETMSAGMIQLKLAI